MQVKPPRPVVDVIVLARTFFDPPDGRGSHADPWSMWPRVDELRRGGFPTTSISDGSGDAELNMPLPDRYDKELAGYEHAVEEAARQIEDAIGRWSRAQNAVLMVMDAKAAAQAALQDEIRDQPGQLARPNAVHCANPRCGRVVENTAADRVRSGRCFACWKYRHRTGNERPSELTPEQYDPRNH